MKNRNAQAAQCITPVPSFPANPQQHSTSTSSQRSLQITSVCPTASRSLLFLNTLFRACSTSTVTHPAYTDDWDYDILLRPGNFVDSLRFTEIPSSSLLSRVAATRLVSVSSEGP